MSSSMALRRVIYFILFNVVVSIINVRGDWLRSDFTEPVTLNTQQKGKLTLTNGLISRSFDYSIDFVTTDFYSHEYYASLLRAINPEAIISLDGLIYPIGGVVSNMPRAYLDRDLLMLSKQNDKAFHYDSHQIVAQDVPYPYTPMRGVDAKAVHWPPRGLRLDVHFKAPYWAPEYHKSVVATVHYEMFQGIPLLRKWVSITSNSPAASTIEANVLSVELLSLNQDWGQPRFVNEYSAAGEGRLGASKIYIETNEPHGTLVTWNQEPEVRNTMPGSFDTAVNCSYQMALAVALDKTFKSFAVHELVVGTLDPERFSLAHHRMLRLLAPQSQESPVFFHMTNSDPKQVRDVIDQLADVGFEMLLYSFGSGFNPESHDPAYIKEIASIVSYAKSRGIEVGGYDLICWTRSVQADWMAVDGRNASFGSACFASGWYDKLTDTLDSFIKLTGISAIETDGPYPGYTCSATYHKHHHGYKDSVYKQNQLQGQFYTMLRKRNVFVNQPDTYFYQGGNKDALGYNENQYSLPRWQDLSISRQDIYDDTFRLPVTAGWMHVPLVDYHGGGSAAEFEPLSSHLRDLEWALAQYFGAGISCAWRGYEIFDSNSTRNLVTKWVSFFKKYRDILTSDLVHIRRPDMQSIDSFMHVNPRLRIKGLAMIFNPTSQYQNTWLQIPLYYTGIERTARVSREAGQVAQYSLDREYKIQLPVQMAPYTITWYTMQ